MGSLGSGISRISLTMAVIDNVSVMNLFSSGVLIETGFEFMSPHAERSSKIYF